MTRLPRILLLVSAVSCSGSATDTVPTQPPPSIASLTPIAPQASPALQSITIVGTGFSLGCTARIASPDGSQVTASGNQITFASPTSLTLQAALTATGTWSIEVINPDAKSSGQFQFTVLAPSTPFITSITPTPAITATDVTMLTVTGVGFETGLTVEVLTPSGATGSSGFIRNVTATSFQFGVFFDQPGTWGVRVAVSGGRRSAVFNLPVITPPPSIIAVTPNPAYGSDAPQAFFIRGKNFDPGSRVTLRNLSAGLAFPNVTIVSIGPSPTDWSVTVSPTFGRTAATWSAEVINSDGRGTGQFQFAVIAPITPVITRITPASPVASASKQGVTIDGQGFVAVATIELIRPGGTIVPTTFTTGMSSTFAGVSGLIDVAGTWGIRITNPDGAQSTVLNFTVLP